MICVCLLSFVENYEEKTFNFNIEERRRLERNQELSMHFLGSLAPESHREVTKN